MHGSTGGVTSPARPRSGVPSRRSVNAEAAASHGRAWVKLYSSSGIGRLGLAETATSAGTLATQKSSVVGVPGPTAFPEAEYASPLAKKPHDLRDAAVSLWLNAGVLATQVA